MKLVFEDTFKLEKEKIVLFCLKQSNIKNGIYFYAMDMIDTLKHNNEIEIVLFREYYEELIKLDQYKSLNFIVLEKSANRYIKWIKLIYFIRKFISSHKSKHFIFTTEDLPVIFLPKLSSKKIYTVVHDLGEFFIRRYSFWKDLYRRFVIKLIVSFSDNIITISEKSKADLLYLKLANKTKISLFYNKVELKNKSIHIKKENTEKYLLYISGLDYPSKNHISFLHDFKNILSEGVNINLYFVGSSSENSSNYLKIKETIKKLSLEDRVKVFTNVTDDEIRKFYINSYAVVFPSLYEGFGRPLIEGLEFEKKVFSNNVGVYQELLKFPEFDSLLYPLSDLSTYLKGNQNENI